MIAQELEVSLHMAFVEARQKRHEFITVEHLLLALLDNPTAAEVLRACAANIEELRKALSRDRTRMTVSGFTQLGLVEMTRKRTRESLAHVLCEPCPTCDGRGEVKTARTVCYDILREILREARAFHAKEFRVLASQAVIDLLQDEESGSLAMLSDFIGKPVSVQVESSYTQEEYDIVLM